MLVKDVDGNLRLITIVAISYNVSLFSIYRVAAMLLMIDNYDSFTYNIVRYLVELGVEVKVVRNDELTVSEIDILRPQKIVISPGPGTPVAAGVSVPLIKAFAGQIPILGICLGHQSIGQAFGGNIIRAKRVMHGKTSRIHHTGTGIFTGLANPFTAMRYHSLVVDQSAVPVDLEVTAWSEGCDGKQEEVMGLRHRHGGVEGIQFHPESVLSEHGHQLLRNFLRL